MSNDTLRILGEALANIAGSIAECVRADVANHPSSTHAEHFDSCLRGECARLRGIGHDGLAASLEAMRAPALRLMTEGW